MIPKTGDPAPQSVLPGTTKQDIPEERNTMKEDQEQHAQEDAAQNSTFFDGGDGTPYGQAKTVGSVKNQITTNDFKKIAQQAGNEQYTSDTGTNYHRDDQFKGRDPEGYGQVEFTGLEDGALQDLPTAGNQDSTREADPKGPIRSRTPGPDEVIEQDIIPSTPNLSNVYMAG